MLFWGIPRYLDASAYLSTYLPAIFSILSIYTCGVRARVVVVVYTRMGRWRQKRVLGLFLGGRGGVFFAWEDRIMEMGKVGLFFVCFLFFWLSP